MHPDASRLQDSGELPALGQNGLGAKVAEPGGEQRELTVGAVAPGGGVQEQDKRAGRPGRVRWRARLSQASSISRGACTAWGTRSGCRMWASSSSPSISRGPGREK